jgi:DNA-directed RNA polymerase subunit RPC12/RpoP
MLLGILLTTLIICEKFFNNNSFLINMKYVCARKSCGKEVSKKELNALPGIKCSHCGFRILYKKRPDVIKRIKVI